MCCESDLILSLVFFQSGVLSVLCSSLYGQGLGSPASWCTLRMRPISYPLFHPTSHQLGQCLHLLPCPFSTPSSVPLWHPAAARVGGPAAGERSQPCTAATEYVSSKGIPHSHVFHEHVCFVGVDLPLPIPVWLDILQWLKTAVR